MKSLALAVFLGLVLVDLAFAQGCVMCPQVVPQCPPSCRDCEIVPQSCDRCSYARCNDNGVFPGDLETRVSRLERVVSRLEQIVENRPVAPATEEGAIGVEPESVAYVPSSVTLYSTGSFSALQPCSGTNSVELRLAQLFKTHGGQRRPAPLVCDQRIQNVARSRAQDMAARGYFSHTNPDGLGPNYLVQQTGYQLPSWWGNGLTSNYIESIAAGYTSADAAWQGWMNSPGHRTHLLAENSFYANQVVYGIGYATGGPYGMIFILVYRSTPNLTTVRTILRFHHCASLLSKAGDVTS